MPCTQCRGYSRTGPEEAAKGWPPDRHAEPPPMIALPQWTPALATLRMRRAMTKRQQPALSPGARDEVIAPATARPLVDAGPQV